MNKFCRLLRSSIFFLIGLLIKFSAFGSALPKSSPLCTYHYIQQATLINGRETPVEYYRPDGPGPFPLLLMLHGSAGAFTLKSSSEPPIDNFGEKTLVQSCLAVVFPHYLEAIGYKSVTTQQEMKSLFPSMINATEIVLKQSEMLPWVKDQPVFIFGESLGGYLSIALSFRHSEVLAVSEVSGGLPQGYLFDRTKTLRVLISHGVDDSMVPMQEAETLRKYCLTKGLHVEMNLYQGVGHYFPDQIKSENLEQTILFFRGQKMLAVRE